MISQITLVQPFKEQLRQLYDPFPGHPKRALLPPLALLHNLIRRLNNLRSILPPAIHLPIQPIHTDPHHLQKPTHHTPRRFRHILQTLIKKQIQHPNYRLPPSLHLLQPQL